MLLMYYVAGSNIHGQINDISNDNQFFCCGYESFHLQRNDSSSENSSENIVSLDSDVQVSLSHIIYKKVDEWDLKGYKSRTYEKFHSLFKSASLVKSCERHIVFIDDNGDVHIASSSGVKKLHLQYDASLEEAKSVLGDGEKSRIVDFDLKENALILVDDLGRLFSSGIEIPISTKIKRVSVGEEHCLALSAEGVLFSWGSGMKGQLGNGEIVTIDSPEIVSAFLGLFISEICCGGWHSIALTSSGDAFMWGWNDVGQLGFPSKSLRAKGVVKWDNIVHNSHESLCRCCSRQGSHKISAVPSSEKRRECELLVNPDRFSSPVNVQASPKLLDFWTESSFVKKVACGDRHSVFLLDNETAWTTGWNLYGQLGLGSTGSRDEPTMVDLFPVKAVHAGGWNTAFEVLIDSS